ncbi:hypothetical protein ACPW96_03985 [Micromonospora sp. DT81.3]|uniref:hypothetical protein n=1 Tax=Micromonospora sp. DT81.3 TaxID=3416523 RepID=UPI003CF71485
MPEPIVPWESTRVKCPTDCGSGRRSSTTHSSAVSSLHSGGDEDIPFELTEEFAAAQSKVTVVETAVAPHGWEANVEPERFQSALTEWFTSGNPG